MSEVNEVAEAEAKADEAAVNEADAPALEDGETNDTAQAEDDAVAEDDDSAADEDAEEGAVAQD